MIRIEVSKQGQEANAYHFHKSEVTIGRSASSDLVLDEPGISGTHVRVIATGQDCMIVDQQSTNGTYVNGERIGRPTPVAAGDEVYICSFRVSIASGAARPEQPESLGAAQPLRSTARDPGRWTPSPDNDPPNLPYQPVDATQGPAQSPVSPLSVATSESPPLVAMQPSPMPTPTKSGGPEIRRSTIAPPPSLADFNVSIPAIPAEKESGTAAPPPIEAPAPIRDDVPPIVESTPSASTPPVVETPIASVPSEAPPVVEPGPPVVEPSPPALAPEPVLRNSGAIGVPRTPIHTMDLEPQNASPHSAHVAPPSFEPGSGSHANWHSLEPRDWPVPAAPKRDLGNDRIRGAVSRVFARLAQPWIELQELPPGDPGARADVYGIAQHALRSEIGGEDVDIESLAGGIADELCAIGPLAELRETSRVEAIEVRGIEAIRVARQGQWHPTEIRFSHPYALHFAIWRLRGSKVTGTAAIRGERLTDGTRLTAVGYGACEGGPYLLLRSAPEQATSFLRLCERSPLSADAQRLLLAALQAKLGILVCEPHGEHDSWWSALADAAQRVHRCGVISWDPQMSLPASTLTLCADRDPERQSELVGLASELELDTIAIDRPAPQSLAWIEASSRTAARGWIVREIASSAAQGCAHLESQFRKSGATGTGPLQALTLVLTIHRDESSQGSRIREIGELRSRLQGGPELQPLFASQNGGELRFVSTSPRVYQQLSRRGITLAPPAVPPAAASTANSQ